MTAIDWDIWTPKDFGLDPNKNILQAPICDCGCGQKMSMLFNDKQWKEFAMSFLHEYDCDWSIIFAVHPNKTMEFIIRNDTKYGFGGGAIENWKDVGKTFDEAELVNWGLMMDDGLYNALNGQHKYKILE